MQTATSWIIASDSDSYWGRCWGVDGLTFVRANAYRYPTAESAAACIADLQAAGTTAVLHVEQSSLRRRYP
ncbi:hypothetical protein KDL01_35760 [Actinospica durhamensis]|uniref:Uncharacterized protein n=1 Tax=Actinospica durhamensis TaxID=1508375 RepID=A0A941IRD6_9ACTN|nr:hypothetical protein [Actinospica durhamensis]MBR7838680.1 hypothetical protein [Actinospica durhamensis]